MKIFLMTLMLGAWVSIGAVEEDLERELRIKKAQEIVLKAQEDWPNNYRMQAHQIETQIEALKKIDKFCEYLNLK